MFSREAESGGAGAGGGGLLQEFRRKIVKYAPSAQPQSLQLQSPRSPETLGGGAFVMLVKRFDEHDELLRQLESALSAMLQQLQTACASMTQAVEVFSQTFRYDAQAYQVGVDFLMIMKMIARDGATMMEQSVRFTVLDPLLAQLEKHDAVHAQLASWRRLSSEMEEFMLSAQRMKTTTLLFDQDDRRRIAADTRLANMQAQLVQLQNAVTPQLEATTNTDAVRKQVDLFTAMRLQVATFFHYADKSLYGNLSKTECEIVGHNGHDTAASTISKPLESSLEPLVLTGTDPLEVREPEQAAVIGITLEEFENGKSAPESLTDGDDEISPSSASLTPAMLRMDVTELFQLASSPVVSWNCVDMMNAVDLNRQTREGSLTSEDTRGNRSPLSDPAKPTDDRLILGSPQRNSGVLASIRRSLLDKMDKFGSPRSTELQIDNAFTEVDEPAELNAEHLQNSRLNTRPRFEKQTSSCLLSLAPSEWQGVESSLWELDVAGQAVSVLDRSQRAASFALGIDFLSGLLLQSEKGLSNCIAYLDLVDIARLAKVNRSLQSHLRYSAPVWKRCIRMGGLTPRIRSTLWLAGLYGSEPWETIDQTPPYLTVEKRKRIYDQLLVKVGIQMTKSAPPPVEQSNLEHDDGDQVDKWFKEIDVDVERTCNKDIYANDAQEEWDYAYFSLNPSELGIENAEPISNHLILNADLQDRVPVTERKQSDPSTTPGSAGAAGARAALEAKIRRVLRAYVMYNPRVGYCQGMNFLVRLLMEVAEDESDVFWLFVGLSEPANNRNIYEPGLAVLQPFIGKLEMLITKQMPELHAHMQREGVHVAAFSARWFLTLFSSFETLGPKLVIRLLDIFVIDGWRIMLSMALVVLDELRELLIFSDLEDMLRILQFPRTLMIEPDNARRRQLLQRALAFSITRMVNAECTEKN